MTSEKTKKLGKKTIEKGEKRDIRQMTQKDFRALPIRARYNDDIGPIDSLVILPTRKIHDSGYRAMDFVAVRDGKAICRLSGCSDVLHIDGIGGLGKRTGGRIHRMVPPVGWSIDCLPKSGLLQLFVHDRQLTIGAALSSFEVYAKRA